MFGLKFSKILQKNNPCTKHQISNLNQDILFNKFHYADLVSLCTKLGEEGGDSARKMNFVKEHEAQF